MECFCVENEQKTMKMYIYTSTIVFPQTEKSHFSWFIMTTGYISTCMSHSLSGEN